MSEKNLLFFYYNFDSTTLFSFGGETIMGQSKYPEILNDLMTLTLMTGNDRSPMISEVSGRFPFRCQFLPLRNNHPVHLLDEILEIHKRVAEGFAPFQIFQRILQEVAGFYVAVHADVIQDVLQIDLLL